MCTVLCSLLLGAGFNAYVVAGYAPLAVTVSDQTSAVCPLLEPHTPKAKPHKMQPAASQRNPVQPKEAKYQIRSNAKPESTFLQVRSFLPLQSQRQPFVSLFSVGAIRLCHAVHALASWTLEVTFAFSSVQHVLSEGGGMRTPGLLHKLSYITLTLYSFFVAILLPTHLLFLYNVLGTNRGLTDRMQHIFKALNGMLYCLFAAEEVLLHLQKQQQAKEAEALMATAPAAVPAAADMSGSSLAAADMSGSSSAAADNEKTNLVHAWVMVLSGKREVCATSSARCLHLAQLSQQGCAAGHQLVAVPEVGVAQMMCDCQAVQGQQVWQPEPALPRKCRLHCVVHKMNVQLCVIPLVWQLVPFSNSVAQVHQCLTICSCRLGLPN